MTFMPTMPVPTFKAGAGRQPFAPIQNLPTSASPDKSQKTIPTSAKQGKRTQDRAPISTSLPKNVNIRQPHVSGRNIVNEDNSVLDESTTSIYARDEAELGLINAGAPAGPTSQVAAANKSKSLKRVRTVNKSTGLAMKERRRKGELDLPTRESIQHVAVLLRQRREAAERFHKF
jgi:hypothetical protein